MPSTSSCPSGLFAGASLLALLAAPPAFAAPAEPVLSFAIPAGSLESALTAYATRADLQLLYTPDVVRDHRTPGLVGDFTAKEALARLLAGTGVIAQESRPGVIVLRIGMVTAPLETVQSEVATTSSMLDEVVVTGTHIRGAAPGASPVLMVDRDEIDRQGYATVADSLSALPQNFSGSATSDVASAGLDATSLNFGRATAINLRGLGPDATLVLVNGRRMAGTGGKGDFADVSAIPTAAVERIDILLDGASALYGADAVGGVVNIILKRNFEGAETRARYGWAKGGAQEMLAAQTLGHVWSTGRALISYEYYEREALPFSARAYTRSADFRPFGGADRRTNIASPGNIVLVDPATNAAVPTWGVPAGRSPLRPSDFVRGVINLQEPRADQDLLPDQDRHSVYAAFGDKHGLFIEALKSYMASMSRETIARLNSNPSGRAGIADYYAALIEAMLDGKRRWGCLVTNSIVEFAMNDPQISEAFQLHLARLETALSGAIERAKQAGELSRDVDAAEAAVFLVCTTQGLNVLAKTRPSRRTLEAITRHAFTALGFEA